MKGKRARVLGDCWPADTPDVQLCLGPCLAVESCSYNKGLPWTDPAGLPSTCQISFNILSWSVWLQIWENLEQIWKKTSPLKAKILNKGLLYPIRLPKLTSTVHLLNSITFPQLCTSFSIHSAYKDSRNTKQIDTEITCGALFIIHIWLSSC